MYFAKKYNKKSLKNTKAISAHAEALQARVKPKVVESKLPKGPNHKLSLLAFITHPKLGNQFLGYMPKSCKPRHQSPKFKSKQRSQLQFRPRLQLQLRLPKLSGTFVKAPQERFLCANVKTEWCGIPAHYLKMACALCCSHK